MLIWRVFYIMSSHHLGQYKGNFYMIDEVLIGNFPPAKARVTRMRFQINPLWFSYSNVCVFIIFFIVSVWTGDENGTLSWRGLKATFHLTISMRGKRATGKIQRNNYHHGNCGLSLTGKTSSAYLIFTHGTHRNVKNRWVRGSLKAAITRWNLSLRFFCIDATLLCKFESDKIWINDIG